MDFGAIPPAAGSLELALLMCSLSMLVAAWMKPWRGLLEKSQRQHLLYGSGVSLVLLWTMSFSVVPGVELHLLGMTAVVLMFGWALAIVLGGLASLAMLMLGTWAPETVGANMLLTTLVPVAVTQALLVAANRLRRPNLFVYLLGVGFAGGALSLLASFWCGSLFSEPGLDHAVVLLMIFPEGFFNGTIITAMAVFAPGLLRTYDEARYLGYEQKQGVKPE